jgi:SAM-dependent methyltransferase
MQLTRWNMDVYHAQVQIEGVMESAAREVYGTLLDVGCGQMPYRQVLTAAPSRVTRYIGMDLEPGIYKNAPDLIWDGLHIPLPDASVDCAITTEVLEHCPEPQVVLQEIGRVLKPGGLLVFTVPFLWPLHDAPYDEYRYTPFALERMLKASGFVDCKIRSMGGWDASFAQMLGLYLKRRPMNETLRGVLVRLAFPLYRWLLRQEQAPDRPDSPMATGYAGRAVRRG